MQSPVTLLFSFLLMSLLLTGCGERNPAGVVAGTAAVPATDTGSNSLPARPWEADNLQVLFQTTDAGSGETVVLLSNKSATASAYFLSNTANFLILRKYAGRRQLIQSDTLLLNEWTYTTVDSQRLQTEVVNGESFLFITVLESFMGQAITEQSVAFKITNLRSLKTFGLNFTGVANQRSGSGIDGAFEENKSLDRVPEIRERLYQYARKSSFIYLPAGKDLDLRYYKNHEQKWEQDNGTDNALANGHNSIPDTIYSTYYKENLFRFTGEYEPEALIENTRYRVVSYFRSNIIAYDKVQQLYFPVFIESCITGCNKTIRFASGNVVTVTYEEGGAETYTVDLDKIIFEK